MKRIIYFTLLLLLTLALPSMAARQSGLSRLGYAIQMGAFADVKNAERFTGMLQAKGLDAFYYRKDSGIYAVRFGDFPRKDKARGDEPQHLDLPRRQGFGQQLHGGPGHSGLAEIRRHGRAASRPGVRLAGDH